MCLALTSVEKSRASDGGTGAPPGTRSLGSTEAGHQCKRWVEIPVRQKNIYLKIQLGS